MAGFSRFPLLANEAADERLSRPARSFVAQLRNRFRLRPFMASMETLAQEFGHDTWLPFPVIAARLLLAAVFGAVVGMEREWRNQPAGLRTHILICLATAAIAILTIEITHVEDFDGQEIRIDPIRLIEATTAGVAFLAAGLIFFARGEVHGLTTGAGMWLAGAIGLAVGLGFWQIASFATLLAVIVLGLLHIAQRHKQPDEKETRPAKPDGSDRGAAS
ncbi:putative Mg2+ transporter-C (MgtC) family protein [Aquamicrobium terrae]|uniref:Protein MgtC n=2 Tax=Aquamicrobium terrae TaxID=1324945 RepID=A0ABV2MWX3_9HYPH